MSNETFAVLWSNNQKCFHVETVRAMLKTNMNAFRDGTGLDYVVLGFADTQREASKMVEELDEMRSEVKSSVC